jgi:hypothetical protein
MKVEFRLSQYGELNFEFQLEEIFTFRVWPQMWLLQLKKIYGKTKQNKKFDTL